MNLKLWNRRRFFNAIRAGNIERVQELLEAGVNPNACDRRGRPALIVAVRSMIVESGVVDALLDAGAAPNAMDDNGLTALDYARRRLAKLGPGPDRVCRSSSLDEHGNLVLKDHEKQALEEMKAAAPGMADEIEDMYIQERRKAALRQFMPRRELRIIIEHLADATEA
jgi:hypothetical protein